MSMTSKADETLAFLRDVQRLHRRGARWRTQTLQLGLHLAELSVFFLVGVAVATRMPSPVATASPVWALLAASGATVAAVELGRARRTLRPRLTVLALQVITASAVGTTILLVAGVSWRVDLDWALGELVGATVFLSVVHVIYAEGVDRLLADGRLATHVAILGSGPAAHAVRELLDSGDRLAVKLVGCYSLDEAANAEPGVRGSLRTLLADCRLEFVDAIVLAPEASEAEAVEPVRRTLRACTQDVYLVPEKAASPTDGGLTTLGPARLQLISRRPISGGGAVAKRAFDIVGSLGLLVFMAPLLAVLAIAIIVDSRGPVLFRQLRVGYNNRLFYILKFRSMRDDATDRLAKQQTVRGDKRVTRVGRIIRRLSLDELPQLFNVLRGEMSLVGPRPHAPGTSIGGQRVHTVVDDYARRHLVRPGITGLAQVRGLRGGLHDRRQVVDRLASDLEYIERWSIWLDIRILLGTVVLELRNRRGC